MAKGKTPKYILERRTPALDKGKPTQSRLEKWRQWIGITFLSLITGYIAIFNFVLPSVDVRASTPLDAHDFLRTPFSVVNTGRLSLNAVDISCDVKRARYTGGSSYEGVNIANKITVPDIAEFAAGDQQDVLCNSNEIVIHQTLEEAQIAIQVSFRPSFWPWRKTKQFSYRTEQQSDGTIRWLRNARR